MLDDLGIEKPLDTAQISQAVQGLFSPSASVAVLDPRRDHGGLMGGEVELMANANPKRQREFTAGRVASRVAMVAMGAPISPILSGRDRAPVWPEGVVGSISHCDECCVAVLGQAVDVAMLGVDVEPYQPLEEYMFAEICTLRELNWLNAQEAGLRGYLAKLIFSAKEAAYKCQYPLTGRIIGFGAIEIDLDLLTGRFSAEFTRKVAPFQSGDRMVGRFAVLNGLILSGMALGM